MLFVYENENKKTACFEEITEKYIRDLELDIQLLSMISKAPTL